MVTRMNPRPGEMPSHFYCTCGCRQGWKPWVKSYRPDEVTEGHPPQVVYGMRKCLWAYPVPCGRPVIGGYTCTQTRGHEPPCSHTVAVYTRAYAPDYKHDPTKVAASGASGFNVERAELPLCECESGRECGAGMQVGRRCALGRAALPVSSKQYPCFCIGRACKMPSETLPDNQYCKKLRR